MTLAVHVRHKKAYMKAPTTVGHEACMSDSSLVNFCSVDGLSGLPGVAILNIKEEHCGLTTCSSSYYILHLLMF